MKADMAGATLTISSKNYSSWSLRGWLLCRMAGLEFAEERVGLDDPDTRQNDTPRGPLLLLDRLLAHASSSTPVSHAHACA